MKRLLITAAAMLAVAACGQGTEGGAATDADTLTRRQKDSIIANSPLPGAGGVGKAMEAVDQANERTRALDTIR